MFVIVRASELENCPFIAYLYMKENIALQFIDFKDVQKVMLKKENKECFMKWINEDPTLGPQVPSKINSSNTNIEYR